MNNILIFAGTYEGRKLCEYLSENNINISVCVATEYGKDILSNMKVYSKRLDENEMIDFIKGNKFDLIIDATHPYATEVTKNIKAACEKTNVQYIRLLREENKYTDMISFSDTNSAVEFLKNTVGNILVTTGSKELSLFCKIPDFERRVFARVLPSLDVLEECNQMGIKGRNLICMQGPFSHSMNVAMLKQFDCQYLVTKNTGSVGGLDKKISACLETNTKVIVIDRPTQEVGYSFSEVIEIIKNKYKLNLEFKNANKEFFPLFISAKNKNILVVGGGKIATRRIIALVKFDFNITVVAPQATAEIMALSENNKLIYIKREFIKEDLDNKYMVITATNDRNLNYNIGRISKEKEILVNVADKKEECDFYFPAIMIEDEVVVGITSGGKSHKLVKDISNIIRAVLGNEN
jgi:precorrin-2 dehydrogenase/sirohydrochlorin ferrochelatase/precorrin-6A/cobalt-precorrin-6A reductase